MSDKLIQLSDGTDNLYLKAPVVSYTYIETTNGIKAYYNGSSVFVTFDKSGSNVVAPHSGWVHIGQLPDSIKPSNTVKFLLYDNNATTQAGNTPIDAEILTDGQILVYLFSDNCQTGVKPCGSVTYIL